MDYTISKSISFVESDKHLLLLNLKDNRYYSLDELGSMILTMIHTGEKQNRIINEIIAKYEVDYDTAVLDYNNFCKELYRKGLLV
ncbi:PqqD family protein [Ornithinibacillus californiensis]|jgi:hypothetical protein|uniref:PqqD family protein n=1 Tax=Ornithinibacillus californiensis TaxID=161536 RepID=UPI00064E0CE4|nr:PqqD family protein [Ornithinibacillus californiensis]